MHYGLSLPNIGAYADARLLATLAQEAEAAGWDGFFIWDSLLVDPNRPLPVVDPWVALAAIAMTTRRIRLGPMVTPLARRRPWKLARETATLDHLSGGRLILGVGLGDPAEAEFGQFGEPTDARLRAQRLDEGLAVLTGLWSGQPFQYQGAHYQVRPAVFLPAPLQSPRIPIWAGGWWPNRAPMRRAARWDGVFPGKLGPAGVDQLTPDELRAILAYIQAHRTSDDPFDAVIAGITPGDGRGAAVVAPYAAAGLTWWLERLDDERGPIDAMRVRLRQGPPR